MKQINVYFDDDEHKRLEDFKAKLNLSWHDFIVVMSTHCKDAEKRGDFKALK